MKQVVLLAVALLACTLWLGGCNAARKKTTIGHPRFEALCVKCHDLNRLEAFYQKASREEMRKVMNRMARKPNSGIQERDVDMLMNEIY